MKNKRTILAFILAIVFLVPSVLLFSGCSFGKKENKEDKYIEIPVPSPEGVYEAWGHSGDTKKEIGKTYYYTFTIKHDFGPQNDLRICVCEKDLEVPFAHYYDRIPTEDYTFKLLDKDKNDVTSILTCDASLYSAENIALGEKYYMEITFNKDTTVNHYEYFQCVVRYGNIL